LKPSSPPHQPNGFEFIEPRVQSGGALRSRLQPIFARQPLKQSCGGERSGGQRVQNLGLRFRQKVRRAGSTVVNNMQCVERDGQPRRCGIGGEQRL